LISSLPRKSRTTQLTVEKLGQYWFILEAVAISALVAVVLAVMKIFGQSKATSPTYRPSSKLSYREADPSSIRYTATRPINTKENGGWFSLQTSPTSRHAVGRLGRGAIRELQRGRGRHRPRAGLRATPRRDRGCPASSRRTATTMSRVRISGRPVHRAFLRGRQRCR